MLNEWYLKDNIWRYDLSEYSGYQIIKLYNYFTLLYYRDGLDPYSCYLNKQFKECLIGVSNDIKMHQFIVPIDAQYSSIEEVKRYVKNRALA